MRVMMSAAGSAVAPSIIRHLQSLGHYVIGHDCSPYGRVADKFYQSPVAHDEFMYGAFLIDHMGICDSYLPFLNEELRFVWEFRKTITSRHEALETFTSKISQQRAFESKSLPVAPSVHDGFGMVLIKPDFGRGGKGAVKINDPIIARQFQHRGHLVQRFIDGDEYTVDVLTGMDGAFLFAVPRLRIQANGVSVIGKIVMDAEIIDLARLVVSKFAFRGPINIQIIRERATSKLYIIELNPRLSGSCIFTVMAGFDILDATIKLWEGKPFVEPDKIEDGLVIRRHYVEERL